MFNSVCGEQQPHPASMKQARKRPGPQTSRDPQGTGPPRRTTAGNNRGLHPERAEESPKADLRQPQCSAQGALAASPQAPPAVDHPRADRALGPETQRPPTPQSGPSKAVGPGPANRPPRVGRRSPEHPAPAREITNAPAASSTGRAWWWVGVD